VLAEEPGEVMNVDARQIIVKNDETAIERVYDLLKFTRSNAGTCINQAPIVKIGEKVVRGQILADVPRPIRARWRSAKTFSWHSCRGKASTMKTPFS